MKIISLGEEDIKRLRLKRLDDAAFKIETIRNAIYAAAGCPCDKCVEYAIFLAEQMQIDLSGALHAKTKRTVPG